MTAIQALLRYRPVTSLLQSKPCDWSNPLSADIMLLLGEKLRGNEVVFEFVGVYNLTDFNDE